MVVFSPVFCLFHTASPRFLASQLRQGISTPKYYCLLLLQEAVREKVVFLKKSLDCTHNFIICSGNLEVRKLALEIAGNSMVLQ